MGEELKTTQSADEQDKNLEGQGQEGQDTNADNAGNEGEGQKQEEKTFTQADLDFQISERLKRERSKQPPKEELEAFKEWKKSQQTEQERIAEERKEFEAVKSELSKLRNEKEVLKVGVDSKYADYVTFEVSKMEGDFADNLADFLKENQQFISKNDNTPNFQAGGQKVANQGRKPDTSQMSDAEYYQWKKKQN